MASPSGAAKHAPPSASPTVATNKACVAQDEPSHQLNWEGWTGLPKGMPRWELTSFLERLHRRYHGRILRLLQKYERDWMKEDKKKTAPGADRPGGLVARRVNKTLEGTGIFVYSAHPSQADNVEDDYTYSGPRWYVTCMEAAMRRYQLRGVAPPPPDQLQALLWPNTVDKNMPWLTEYGWTVVPPGSEPQVMHADICSYSEKDARQPGQGRYQHFVWKMDPAERCTTNIVPGAFTQGCADWDHYGKWTIVNAPALIFDSEMLHRGGATPPGAWSTTLTMQLCSGTGWPALQEQVSESLMCYTQPLGWEDGAAVDALIDGIWQPAVVVNRSSKGMYRVVPDEEKCSHPQIVRDSCLRYRESVRGVMGGAPTTAFSIGDCVEALFDSVWYPARIDRVNADGTYRVIWKTVGCTRSFTDGIVAEFVRSSSLGCNALPNAAKRKRGAETSGFKIGSLPTKRTKKACGVASTSAAIVVSLNANVGTAAAAA